MGLLGKLFGMGPKSARDYFNRGLAHCTKGEFDKAIEDFTEAIRLDLKDAGAYYNRGNAYCGKVEWDKAIADYTEAIQLDPKDANLPHTTLDNISRL